MSRIWYINSSYIGGHFLLKRFRKENEMNFIVYIYILNIDYVI